MHPPLTHPTRAGHLQYNYIHARTRNVVERAFGILKGRFRILLKMMVFTKREASRGEKGGIMWRNKQVINACVRLHNWLILNPAQDVADNAERIAREEADFIATAQRVEEEAEAERNAKDAQRAARPAAAAPAAGGGGHSDDDYDDGDGGALHKEKDSADSEGDVVDARDGGDGGGEGELEGGEFSWDAKDLKPNKKVANSARDKLCAIFFNQRCSLLDSRKRKRDGDVY